MYMWRIFGRCYRLLTLAHLYHQPAQETNAMNKSVTNLWNLSKPQAQSAPELASTQEGIQEGRNADSEPTAVVEQDTKMKKRSKSSIGGSHKRVRSKLVLYISHWLFVTGA
jgi:hypothetical protein